MKRGNTSCVTTGLSGVWNLESEWLRSCACWKCKDCKNLKSFFFLRKKKRFFQFFLISGSVDYKSLHFLSFFWKIWNILHDCFDSLTVTRIALCRNFFWGWLASARHPPKKFHIMRKCEKFKGVSILMLYNMNASFFLL